MKGLVEHLDSAEIARLELVRKIVKQEVPLFPHGLCKITSKLLEDLFGYRAVFGTYQYPRAYNLHRQYHAVAACDTREVYIDLSAQQFDLSPVHVHPPILVLPFQNELFRPIGRGDLDHVQYYHLGELIRSALSDATVQKRSSPNLFSYVECAPLSRLQ